MQTHTTTRLSYLTQPTRTPVLLVSGKGSLLDLGIASTNIRQAVTNFEVDTDNEWTRHYKNEHKTIAKKSSDQRSISLNMTLPCILTNNKKRPVINFNNPEGWERYKKVSEEYVKEIPDSVDNIQDINEFRIKIHIINLEIQLESFGITWEGPSNQKKK